MNVISIRHYLSLIKFSHTVFAMPFAFIGFFMGVDSQGAYPDWSLFLKVVLCMVFARSAAMAFNRYIDRDFDAINQRTAIREIPAGVISAKSALVFVIVSSLAFILVSALINPLCFALSPVALAIVLGYSYTKRFTWLCHLVLGLGLALAPVGAYLAVTAQFAFLPVIVGLAVLFWTSGFDIIYALQDEEFDKSTKLHSIPVWLGKRKALNLSSVLHVITSLLLACTGVYAGFGYLFFIGLAVFLALLLYQHSIVKPNDLSRVNLAFGTTNGIASVIFATFYVLEFFIHRQ